MHSMLSAHARRSFSAAAAAAVGRGAPAGQARKGLPTGLDAIPGVQHVIAVASGKGGVGKSTTAANLAAAMAMQERFGDSGAQRKIRVGLLDADIYGPSVPRLMNLRGRPQLDRDSRMIPLQNYGISCMSMGFLMDDGAPAVWRGPMVMSALEKLVRGTAWGELDVLIVDMPPGTGDAQLSLTQRVPLAGAVIVTTPQEIALIDARRGAAMFRKVDVPILGLVENMSYHACEHCGSKSYIFGEGGGKQTAQEMDMEFLGEVPLVTKIRETSDAGKPIVAVAPESASAQAYINISQRVIDKLSSSSRTLPRIAVT
eukprot:jgi/Chlat1/8725/Chrsp9S00719